MNTMGYLIESLASGLQIKTNTRTELEGITVIGLECEYRPAPNATREAFKDRLHVMLEGIKQGGEVVFTFNYEGKKGANEQLEKMLIELPTLNEDSQYVFPDNTIFGFRFKEDGNREVELSQWIQKRYLQLKNKLEC